MPKSKSRKKKHNQNRRAQNFFGHRTRVTTFEAGRDAQGDQIAYAQKHMGTFWRPLRPDVTQTVLTYPQNWAVCIRAICWTGSGDWWVEESTVIVKDLALEHLHGVYLEHRQQVLAEVQTRHVYDLGWMAETYLGKNPADDPRWPYAEIDQNEFLTPERQAVWRRVNEHILEDQRRAA